MPAIPTPASPMPANSSTTREVLLDVIRFHGDLASHYETLRDTVEEADSQVLLEYLYRHERNLQSAVSRCGTELRDEVLETVLETPLEFSRQLPSALELPLLANEDVATVVELGRQMDRTLISLYERLMRAAPSEPVRRLFRGLLTEERHEEERLAMASLCLQDI